MAGRPPTDPAIVARALELVAGGLTPEEAARHPEMAGRISQRAIYNAAAKARKAKPVRSPAAKPRPPEPIRSAETDLEIVEAEIKAVRESLREARADDAGPRTASLLGELRKLMQDRRDLRPPPPPTDGEEEARWRADRDAVVRAIEAGVVEAETRAARTNA